MNVRQSFAPFLVLILILGLFGCGKDSGADPNKEDNPDPGTVYWQLDFEKGIGKWANLPILMNHDTTTVSTYLCQPGNWPRNYNIHQIKHYQADLSTEQVHAGNKSLGYFGSDSLCYTIIQQCFQNYEISQDISSVGSGLGYGNPFNLKDYGLDDTAKFSFWIFVSESHTDLAEAPAVVDFSLGGSWPNYLVKDENILKDVPIGIWVKKEYDISSLTHQDTNFGFGIGFPTLGKIRVKLSTQENDNGGSVRLKVFFDDFKITVIPAEK